MSKLLLFLLLLPFIGLSQTTYKSLASEYIFKDLPSSIPEMMERDIIISDKTIVVKSYGKQATDIQTWKIQSIEGYHIEPNPSIVYYVELASGEEYEYPASFTLQFDKDEKVETITCVIPPNKHLNLPDNSPAKIRFIID